MNEFFQLNRYIVEEIIRTTLFTAGGFIVGFVCGAIFVMYKMGAI